MTSKNHDTKVMEAFAAQQPYDKDYSPFWTNGDEVLSYRTTILYRDNTNTYYHNTRTYSQQTAGHQRAVREWLTANNINAIPIADMPYSVRSAELVRQAKTLLPAKLKQLKAHLQSVLTTAVSYGHTPIMDPERPTASVGATVRCADCDAKVRVKPHYSDDEDGQHYTVKGNLIRRKCPNPRQWPADQRPA